MTIDPRVPRSRRRRVTAILAATTLAFALAACGGDEGGSDGSEQDPASLEGNQWVVTEILDDAGNTVVVDVGIDASFDGSTVTGDAACNSYSASYQAEGSDITISAVNSTLAACPEDEQGVANRYLELLGEAASFSVEGGSMSMSDAEGTPIIQFE